MASSRDALRHSGAANPFLTTATVTNSAHVTASVQTRLSSGLFMDPDMLLVEGWEGRLGQRCGVPGPGVRGKFPLC